MQSSWRRGGPKKNTGGHRKMKPQPKSASFKMLRDPPPQEPRPPCRAASIRRRCRSRTTSSSRRSTRERAGEGKYKHHTAPNSTSPSHACKLCLPLSFCSSLSLSALLALCSCWIQLTPAVLPQSGMCLKTTLIHSHEPGTSCASRAKLGYLPPAWPARQLLLELLPHFQALASPEVQLLASEAQSPQQTPRCGFC